MKYGVGRLGESLLEIDIVGPSPIILLGFNAAKGFLDITLTLSLPMFLTASRFHFLIRLPSAPSIYAGAVGGATLNYWPTLC